MALLGIKKRGYISHFIKLTETVNSNEVFKVFNYSSMYFQSKKKTKISLGLN